MSLKYSVEYQNIKEYMYSYLCFRQYGKVHRINGPAKIWADRVYEWWIVGKCTDKKIE
jgi:hypothetical protein